MTDRREQFSSTSDAGFVLKPPQAKGKGKKDEVDHLVENANQLIASLSNQNKARQEPIRQDHSLQEPFKTNSTFSNDPQFAFFYTILPDFRKLNHPDKREFKIKVSSILNEYISKYDDEDDSSCELLFIYKKAHF